MLGYLDKEFKRIEELERDMRRQMKAVISRFHFWSVFFPTTFYRSVNNEISTRGYKNLVDFYKRAQDQKSGFVRYCIKKVFFSNFSKVVPYLTGDQNVYRAGGRLPGNAVPGILLTVLYIMGSAAIAYIRFCKALFQLPENRFEQPKEGKVELKQGEFRPFAVEGDLLSDQMYCLLSGETGELKKSPLDYKISLDGVDLSGNKRRRNFIYLPHPDDIPGDIKVNDLIDLAGNLLKIDTLEIREAFNRHNGQSLLNKSFESLKRIEKGEFLLALLSTGPKDIYHINDISSGIHPVFDVRLKSRMEGLIQRGALVIFLTHDDILRMKSLDTGQYFYPAHSWCNIVDRYAGMDEMRKALAIYEQ